ncbi:hypothetical protein EOW66_19390 [Sinirhodobacter huangdaonensis]|uniref:Transposase n=1 Tax=Paenirhodobacter huangdaonensis TaxID=2501515 RepID=A0A3S3L8K7_9RHOB|nr:hypothetical protein EOW66_19390 [Sinirhodobacter huangdaonensis]
MSKRRNQDAGFKARVVLEVVKDECLEAELAAQHGVHPTMIDQWKKALQEGASDIFERGGKRKAEVDEETARSLHAKIGDWAIEAPLVRAQWRRLRCASGACSRSGLIPTRSGRPERLASGGGLRRSRMRRCRSASR